MHAWLLDRSSDSSGSNDYSGTQVSKTKIGNIGEGERGGRTHGSKGPRGKRAAWLL